MEVGIGPVLYIVVAAAGGIATHFGVGVSDSAGGHLVQCAVATTGVETQRFVGVLTAALADIACCILCVLGDID